MKQFFTILIGLFISSIFYGQSFKDLISEGSKFYHEKNYSASFESYKKAFENGDGEILSGHYYNAACSAALAGEKKQALKMIDKSVEAGWQDKTWMNQDSDLESIKGHKKWKKAIAKIDKKIDEYVATLKNPELRSELLEMMAIDQELRKSLSDYEGDERKIVWDQIKEVDHKNTERMKQIIAEQGWPTYDDVGEDGAGAAWILVQHADQQPAFQEECLPMIKAAYEKGQAKGSNYAYLYDRVALKKGQKQRFGSQAFTNQAGERAFQKIEDEWLVNERREKYGMGPLEEYAPMMNFEYILPTEKEAKDNAISDQITAKRLRKSMEKQMEAEDFQAASETASELVQYKGNIKSSDYYNTAVIALKLEEPDNVAAAWSLKNAIMNGWDQDILKDENLKSLKEDKETWLDVLKTWRKVRTR